MEAHQMVCCPSRHTNPFATCWTRPGAIEFCLSQGQCTEQLVVRLAANNWWGEIIGPHGSGKSTLLETLKPHLVAAGRSVSAITLRNRQRRLPAEFLRRALASALPLVIVDGYEQLSWISRVRLRWRCRRASAGLLVTSHAAGGLPLLIRLEPDFDLAKRLVATLTEQVPSLLTAADVAASHACHGSNLRELFFDLYDRHERCGRTTRTDASSGA